MKRAFGKTLAVAFGTVLLAAPAALEASPITFSGSSGSKAASVSFDISGSSLIVQLTNTSSADTLVPTDLLTAVFFNISGNPLLTRTSVVLAPGSTVIHGVSDPGGVVGGEFGYKNGLSQYGVNTGISNSGLGVFGPGDVFPGSNLSGPADPDGPQFGIVSAGDNALTGNAPIMGNPLIDNSVIITLGGLPGGFSLTSISGVMFQYGTALTEGNFTGSCIDCITTTAAVPEPTTLVLLGSGLLGASRVRRRRK